MFTLTACISKRIRTASLALSLHFQKRLHLLHQLKWHIL